MPVKTDVKTPVETAVTDRRRPGRVEQISPALIPIMRTGELPSTVDEIVEYGDPDQVAGARGLIFGVAISAPLWVGIAYLGRWLFT